MITASLPTFPDTIDGLIDLVDELTYINYRHNRNLSPHISVERWELVYGAPAPAMEARYQAEKLRRQS